MYSPAMKCFSNIYIPQIGRQAYCYTEVKMLLQSGGICDLRSVGSEVATYHYAQVLLWEILARQQGSGSAQQHVQPWKIWKG